MAEASSQPTGGAYQMEQTMHDSGKLPWCVSWRSGNRHIKVTQEKLADVQVSVKADMFETTKQPGIKYQNKSGIWTAQMPLPPYGEDNTALGCSLYSLFSTDIVKDKSELAFDLEKLKTWPVVDFVEAVLKTVEKIQDNIKVVFCVQSESKKEEVVIVLDSQPTADNGWVKDTKYAGVTPQRSIDIKVVKGCLEKEEADVLVCTMPSDLDLGKAGSSMALLKAAGQGLQKELDDKYPEHNMDYGEIAVVKGYKLRCKHVLLGIMNRYSKEFDTYREGEDKFYGQNVHHFMVLCLEKADELQAVSVAFPAIGSGNLSYPLDIVAEEMFNAVYSHLERYPHTHVQEIKFVIFHDDDEALQVFKDIQKMKITSSSSGNPELQEKCPVSGSETERNSKCDGTDRENSTEELIHPQGPDEVDQLCISFNKHTLDDSDTGNSDNQATQKNQKTFQTENATCRWKKRFELIHLFTENIIMFFLSDLFEKYRKKNVAYVFKESCVTVDGPDEMILCAFEKEYTSATNKLRNNLTVDLLEVGDNFDLDFRMFPEYGVCVEYIKDKRQVKFYGTKWSDVQTVKQKMRMEVQPNYKPKERKRDFGQPQNPAEENQGARPKVKNSNIPSETLKKSYKIKTVAVKIYKSNILHLPVGCIVNAANRSLQHNGGVARVIADAAGKALIADSERYVKTNGKLQVGEVCTTSAGKLSYSHVIHAVGPCWSYYKPHTPSDVRRCENDLLKAIKNSLLCADSFCEKVAFTAISAGQFGCPLELCAVQYGRAVLDYTRRHNHPLKEIHFVDLNQDIVCEIRKVFAVIESTGNIPAHYDSSVFVRPTAASVHTSHGSKGSRPPTGPYTVHEKPAISSPTGAASTHTYPNSLPVSGLPERDKVFTCLFSENFKLFVYIGDILAKEDCGVMVCGENVNGIGKGYLSKKFSEVGGLDYQKAKESGFKGATHGDVIVCKAGRNPCKFIAHVVLPKNNDLYDEKKMTATFNKLFTAVKNKKCHSVALPLLGTGKGKVDTGYCTRMLYMSMMQFCQEHTSYTVQVYLINIENEKTSMIINTVQTCVADTRKQHNPPPERPPQPTTKQEKISKPVARTKSAPSEKKKSSIVKKNKNKARSANDEGSSSSQQSVSRENSQDDSKSNTFSAREMCGDSNSEDDDYGFKPRENSTAIDSKNSQDNFSKDKQKKKGNVQLIDESTENISRLSVHEDLDDNQQTRQQPEAPGDCVICMDEIKDPKTLPCGHTFCVDCIDAQFQYKEACPTCGAVCGVITGDQPEGTMSVYTNKYEDCSGYKGCGRIEITYRLSTGQQQSYHPSPGMYYRGITRKAYLPNNHRGQQILAMLKVAFDRKLIFTIGSSRTTGQQGVITWNDIHHKTDPKPHTPFGYPDPTYLDRVVDELKAKGVTEADIQASGNRHSTRL